MKHLPEAIARIETMARATKAPLPNMAGWAEWFKFDTCGNDPQLVKALEASARYVLRLRDRQAPNWLSLVGQSGTGKTMLARRIFRYYSESELSRAEVNEANGEITYPGQFCHWPTFAEELRAGRGFGRLDDMIKEKFVVIDDIGLERDTTGFVTEKLSILLSARVGKWTVITSNLGLRQIAEKLDTRIASRMIREESVLVDVQTSDYNARKNRTA